MNLLEKLTKQEELSKMAYAKSVENVMGSWACSCKSMDSVSINRTLIPILKVEAGNLPLRVRQKYSKMQVEDTNLVDLSDIARWIKVVLMQRKITKIESYIKISVSEILEALTEYIEIEQEIKKYFNAIEISQIMVVAGTLSPLPIDRSSCILPSKMGGGKVKYTQILDRYVYSKQYNKVKASLPYGSFHHLPLCSKFIHLLSIKNRVEEMEYKLGFNLVDFLSSHLTKILEGFKGE